MEPWSVLTVFIFMIALLCAVSYGGSILAKWEAQKTKEEIDGAINEIRKQILGKP